MLLAPLHHRVAAHLEKHRKRDGRVGMTWWSVSTTAIPPGGAISRRTEKLRRRNEVRGGGGRYRVMGDVRLGGLPESWSRSRVLPDSGPRERRGLGGRRDRDHAVASQQTGLPSDVRLFRCLASAITEAQHAKFELRSVSSASPSGAHPWPPLPESTTRPQVTLLVLCYARHFDYGVLAARHSSSNSAEVVA